MFRYIWLGDECIGAMSARYCEAYPGSSSYDTDFEEGMQFDGLKKAFFYSIKLYNVAPYVDRYKAYELESEEKIGRMITKIYYSSRFVPDNWDQDAVDHGIVYAEYDNCFYVIIDLKPGIEWEVLEAIANSISFDTPEGPFHEDTHWQ